MRKNKLQHAIGLAMTGVGILAVATDLSASTTYYNTFNANSSTTGAVDGLVVADFTGLATGATPFGYSGSAPVNWATRLTEQNDSATISRANAIDTYGVSADMDTAIGAWNDGKYIQIFGTHYASAGWLHQMDEGLILSDHTQYVTVSLAGATTVTDDTYQTINTDWQFGISIFEGMDTGTNFAANAHSSWNDGYCPASAAECTTPSLGLVEADNPPGFEGLTFKTFSDNSSVTFLAQGGQIYSVFLGGNNLGHNLGKVSEYEATITTAPVPIPMASWLFGTSLLSLLGYRRRKGAVAK